MAEPPSLAGAVQVTVAEESPAIAVTPVGAPGIVIGVTALDAAETGPTPAGLVAVTVNVYVEPFTSSENAAVIVLPSVFTTRLSGDDVTV